MKQVNHPELLSIIKKFIADRDWEQFHSVKNLSMALSVEASELMEIFQWMKEEDSNRIQQDPVLKQKLEDELADVFVYLMRIADRTEVDLHQAVLRKMEKNAAKYPVELARGNSKKYDQY